MPWTIAICEDQQIYRDELCQLVKAWARHSGQDIEIRLFEDPLDFISAWQTPESFDALLLDIEFPKEREGGIALAEMVRRQDEAIPIIFVTNHSELAYKGYPLEALDFLRKKLEIEAVFAALDRLAKRLKQIAPSYFLVKVGDEALRIPFRSIFFFSSCGHYISINDDEALRFREKMDDLALRLSSGFARIHQRTIVNLEHVHQIHPYYVTLDDEEKTRLDVSRRYQKALVQAFHEYCRLL